MRKFDWAVVRCRLGHSALLCALLLALTGAAHATDYTWSRPASNGYGHWRDAENWTPTGVPDSGDTATISSGAGVSLSGTERTVSVLNLSSAFIDNGTLRVSGAMNWTGGEVSCHLISDGTLSISGADDKSLSSDITNNGTATWSTPAENTGRIATSSSGALRNIGTFQAASDGTIFIGDGDSREVTNTGTFAKTGGAGITRVMGANQYLRFEQLGTIRCDIGVLSFGDDGSELYLSDVNTLAGAGIIRISGGTTYLQRPTTVAGTLELVAGDLRGDDLGSFSRGSSGLLRWLGGRIRDTTNIRAGMPVEISGAEPKYLYGGTLNNAGNITWSTTAEGVGQITQDGNTFNNLEGGVFTLTSDATVFNSPSSSDFVNYGTLVKTTGGVSRFQGTDRLAFYNRGLINVQAGVLAFNIRFDSNAGSRLVGAGRVRLDSGILYLNNPTVLNNVLEIAGGTLYGNSEANLSNGGGGSVQWTGGTFSNTVNISSGLDVFIYGPLEKAVSGTVNNSGNVYWSAPNDVSGRIFLNGNRFNNRGLGTFTATTGGSVFSGTGTVLNEGTFTLTPNLGRRRIAAYLENSGTLNVGNAELNLDDFRNNSNGVVSVTLGGTAPGSQHGTLSVVDYAGLAGTLNVTVQPGFAPVSGNRFVVLTDARREGTFTTIRGLSLGAGRLLAAVYDPGLTLVARFSPVATALSPRSGFVRSSVVITGANLGNATAVRFAGNVNGTITSRATSRLAVTVPLGAQSGPLTVQSPAGTATTPAFTVLPRLLNVSPRAAVPGTTVLLTGDGLFNGTTPVVKFNGVTARIVNAPASGNRITVIVPVGATSGFITVTTRSGTARTAFAFSIAPRITSFTPSSGRPGTSVVITGASFVGVRAVYFGSSSAIFKVESPSKIRVTVPARARTSRIVVVTAAGTASSAGVFTVVSAPTG